MLLFYTFETSPSLVWIGRGSLCLLEVCFSCVNVGDGNEVVTELVVKGVMSYELWVVSFGSVFLHIFIY